MKTLKLLFNKVFWVALFVIVQCAIFVISATYLYSYFWYINLFFSLFGVVTFLVIVNAESTPEMKLPWLVLVCLAPLLGCVLYAMFSQNNVKRHYDKNASKNREVFDAAIKESIRLSPTAETFNATGLPRLLRENCGFPAMQNTQVTYFPFGEAMFESLLKDLQSAKYFIFMEYFIIEQGKMWNSILEILKQKVSEGVDVRVVYDDIGSARRLRSGYYKKLRKMGISCEKFNPFRPIVSGVHNNRDHRKITVIDGQIAYTGGVNMADEYINHTHPLGTWKDTAIRLNGEGVNAFTLLFLGCYQKLTGKISTPTAFLTAEGVADSAFVQPFGTGPKSVYRDGIAESILLNLIYSAQEKLWITTPYFIVSHSIKSALCDAALRGVDVRLITPRIPDKKLVYAMTRSNYAPLLSAGVKILEYAPGFIHAKNVVVDENIAMCGTINLDYRSLSHHFECGAVLYGGQAVSDMRKDFEETALECIEIPTDFHQKPLTRLLCALLRIFAPLL